MTTLADLTPEERAQCRGMWCGYNRYTEGGEPSDFVIMVEDVNEAGRIPCINPGAPSPTVWAPAPWMLTPRYDLPRAWTPDGQPVPGEWEDGHVVVSYDDPDPGILKDAVSIEGLSEGGMSYYDAPPNGIEVKLDKFGEGEGKARRWVGEWEEA